MANYKTGAQRYNDRMDKIMDTWRKNEREKLEPLRKNIIEKFPHLKDSIGITHHGLYMHNCVTGFNELIDNEDAHFLGESPY